MQSIMQREHEGQTYIYVRIVNIAMNHVHPKPLCQWPNFHKSDKCSLCSTSCHRGSPDVQRQNLCHSSEAG